MRQLTRRQFLETVGASAAAACITGCTTSSADFRVRREKPNIVFILADDLGYGDLSCYGQAQFKTPNIDRIAAEGLKFTQHYAGSAVCAPSRCSLMTGLHTGHCQIRGNKGVPPEGQWPLQPGTVTLASVLKQAGYATGAFGKWGLGSPGSSGDPNSQGFDEFFGYNCQSLAHKYYPAHLWHNQEKILLPENDPEKQTGQYAHDLIMNKALGFIERNKTRPFFAFLPVTIPHAELTAPADSMQKYAGRYPEDKPFTPKNEKGYGTQLQPRAAFAAMVDRLDGNVGQILRMLKQSGIEKDTIVIFSSDNGPHREGGADPDFFNSNGPLQGYKRDLYEGGIRVPLLVSWPGRIAPGRTTDHISAFWDFLPTLAAIAHLTPPPNDGISLVPTLTNTAGQKQHDYLYWEFHEQGGKQAVRAGNWKAVRLNAMQNPDAPVELYDLSADINEQNNLAAQCPDIAARLAGMMKEAHKPNSNFPFYRVEA